MKFHNLGNQSFGTDFIVCVGSAVPDDSVYTSMDISTSQLNQL